MSDLISREALKKHIIDLFEEEEKIDKKWAMGLKYSLKIVDNAPTVTFSKEICSGCGRYIREKEEADNEHL